MSGTGHEDYADWDAAYVLGALTPADRHAYEAHLGTCARCREAVAELAAMPGLLAGTRPGPGTGGAGSDAPPPMPDDLVERVVLRDARRRRFRRWALAAVLALATLIGVPTALLTRDTADGMVVALRPTGATTMRAEVGFEPAAWGTELSVECHYPPGTAWSGPDGPWSYALVVTDADGDSSQVSSWNAVGGATVTLTAASAVPVGDIASVAVVTAGGETVLSADIGG